MVVKTWKKINHTVDGSKMMRKNCKKLMFKIHKSVYHWTDQNNSSEPLLFGLVVSAQLYIGLSHIKITKIRI